MEHLTRNKPKIFDVDVLDLASLRMLLGASPDEMGEILGVSKTIYRSMESGKRELSWN